MAELSQSARNYLDDISRQPAARQPATFGEIWKSEWNRTGLDTITGVGEPLRNATDELRTAIATAAGKSLEEYAAERRIQIGAGATVDQRIKSLNDLADTLPDEAKKTIDPLRDVRRRAATNAQKTEKDAAEVSASTYGLGGVATSFAAGVARQTTDPVNLGLMAITAPIGGPITGGAAKFIGGQFVAGAISQAAVEPYIEPARAELGLESGLGRAATNILEAGVGGAVLGAAGVGVHRLFRAAADSYRGARPAEAAVQPSLETPSPESPSPVVGPSLEPRTGDDVFGGASRHPNLTSEDFDALALHAERDAAVAAPPDADPVVHAETMSQAARSLEEGRPMPRTDADPVPVAPEPPAVAAQPELPLAKPIEPKGPPAEVKEPVDVIGDPVLAQDVDRRLAQMDDADTRLFHIEQADKTIKAGSAKSFLREIQDDANAVKELIDCIGQEPK